MHSEKADPLKLYLLCSYKSSLSMLQNFSYLELGQKWVDSDGELKKMHTRFPVLNKLGN